MASSKKKIVTFSFAIDDGQETQEVLSQAHQLIRDVTPANWNLTNLSVRDPQYGAEMLQTALTGSN